MIQRHLFDNPVYAGIERALHSPVAARRDPVTSHQAAREITASGKREGQCLAVLALVKKYPRRTSLELSHCGGLERHTIARRLPELEKGGLIKRAGIRECAVGLRLATIWEAL